MLQVSPPEYKPEPDCTVLMRFFGYPTTTTKANARLSFIKRNHSKLILFCIEYGHLDFRTKTCFFEKDPLICPPKIYSA